MKGSIMADHHPETIKASGEGDKMAGNVKQGVGEVTGDEALKRQGENQEDQGALKKAWGNIKSIFTSKTKH